MLFSFLLAFSVAASQAEASNKAVEDFVAQAHKAMTSGKPQEAVNLLRRAIDLEPARADLYLMRSRALDSSGKMDAALDDANKYIELEPNDAFGYLNRSRVYMSMDKSQLALADATKAIELEPNEPDGYYRRSDIYLDLGKNAEAKADEAKAEELDKKARRSGARLRQSSRRRPSSRRNPPSRRQSGSLLAPCRTRSRLASGRHRGSSSGGAAALTSARCRSEIPDTACTAHPTRDACDKRSRAALRGCSRTQGRSPAAPGIPS
jgi:tetratricopeptide (TPR) repeat protein